MKIEPLPAEAVHTARFGRDAAITLSSAIFSRGSVFLLQVGTARLLGVVAFNVFVTATIIGAVVYLLSDLGLRQAVIVSASGDESLARGAAATLRSVRRKVAVGVTALGVGAVAGVASTRSDHVLAGTLIVLSYAIQSYARFLRSPLRAAARVAAEAKLEWLERAAVLLGAGLGLLAGSLVWVGVGSTVGSMVGLLVTRRASGRGWSQESVTFTRSPLRYGTTLSAAVAVAMLSERLDYILLLQIGTELDAAVYAAAYTLVLASSMVYVALSDTAFAYLVANDSSRRQYLALVGLAGICAMFVIGVTGPFVVGYLFGLDHPDLVPLCWILGLGATAMAFSSTIGVFAPMAGRERRMTGLIAGAAVVTVVLCLVLIPRLGIVGAAIATVVNEAIAAIGWWVSGRRYSGTPNEPPRAHPRLHPT